MTNKLSWYIKALVRIYAVTWHPGLQYEPGTTGTLCHADETRMCRVNYVIWINNQSF